MYYYLLFFYIFRYTSSITNMYLMNKIWTVLVCFANSIIWDFIVKNTIHIHIRFFYEYLNVTTFIKMHILFYSKSRFSIRNNLNIFVQKNVPNHFLELSIYIYF